MKSHFLEGTNSVRLLVLCVAVLGLAAMALALSLVLGGGGVPGVQAAQVTAISAGGGHTCAVVDGAAHCWGHGADGRLGNGDTADSDVPAPVCAPGATPPCTSGSGNVLTGVTTISAGLEHTCAVKDGTAYCWGWNPFGQLGDGGTENSSVPVPVCAPGATPPCTTGGGNVLTGVTAMDAGHFHTCAAASGDAWCWGSNSDQQLGGNLLIAGTTNLSGGVTDVASGRFHSCAVQDASAWCWGASPMSGSQLSPQLGAGVEQNGSAIPLEVCAVGESAPCTAGNGNTLTDVSAITIGENFTCAIAGGDALCWGFHNDGELGDGGSGDSNVPVYVCAPGDTPPCTPGNNNTLSSVTVLSVGFAHSCAVKDSIAWCWGAGLHGRLGNGETASSFVPATVCAPAATPPCAPGGNALTGVSAISAGGQHSCAIVNLGAWCWGSNERGQLGGATSELCSVSCSTVPVQVSGLEGPMPTASPTPTLPPTPTPTPAGTPTPTTLPDATPTPTPSSTPEATPSPGPGTPTPTPTPPPGLLQGDVDCNDIVNSVDALMILREVADLAHAAECMQKAGDINCDGAITAVDSLGILRYVAGLPPLVVPEGCAAVGTLL